MEAETQLAGRPPQTRIAGRYVYERELGHGGAGRVLLVRDNVSQELLALKLVAAGAEEQVRSEFTLLSTIAHPSLARVLGLLRVDEAIAALRVSRGSLALISEFVPGLPADKAVRLAAAGATRAAGPSAAAAKGARTTGPKERQLALALGVLDKTARALAAIHAHGFVHGDVKPANVIVSEDGRGLKLIDLGLARAPGFEERPSGTPDFMAPELFRGELSPAVDIYALGVSVWRLLAPLPAASLEASPAEVLARALADPSRSEPLPGWVPAPLVELLATMRSADRARRPSDARELIDEIARLATALPVELAAELTQGAAESRGWKERAVAVSALPLVGQADARRGLAEALERGGAVAVVGPEGAGRSRLVRDAVAAVQLSRATAGGALPAYRVSQLVPVRLDAGPSIYHVVGADRVSAVDVERFVRAAEVEAVPSVLVLERTQPLTAAELTTVEVGPLARREIESLVQRALGRSARITPDAIDEAAAVSGGLAAQLSRMLSAGLASGRDLTRAGEWRSIASAADAEKPATGAATTPASAPASAAHAQLSSGALKQIAAVPPIARRLAELLSVAGGSLPQSCLSACFDREDELGEAARLIASLGLAARAGDGRLRLRADLARDLWEALGEERRRAYAQTIVDGSRSAAATAAAVDRKETASTEESVASQRGRRTAAAPIVDTGELRESNAPRSELSSRHDASASTSADRSAQPSAVANLDVERTSREPRGTDVPADRTNDPRGANSEVVRGSRDLASNTDAGRRHSNAAHADAGGSRTPARTTGSDSRSDAFLSLALGRRTEAVRGFCAGVRDALSSGDPALANELANEASAYLGEGDRTLELAALRAEALRALGDYADALAVVAPWLDSGAPVTGLGELKLLQAEILRLQGDGVAASDAAQSLLENEPKVATSALALGASALLARLALDSGDFERAEREARRVHEDAGDDPRGLRAAEVLSLALTYLGRDAEAQAVLTPALHAARARSERAAEARLWSVEGSRQRASAALRAAAVSFGRAFELADAAGEFHAAASFLVNLGTAQLDAGELGTALETLRDGARRLARLGRERDVARTLYNLALARQLVGDYPDALRIASRAHAAALRAGDFAGAAFACLLRAEIAHERGDASAARAALEGLPELATLPATERVGVGSRAAALYAAIGDEPAASGFLTRAEIDAEQAGSEDVELGLARTAWFALRRESREAQREAERALARAGERGEFALHVLALSAAARAAESRGDSGLMRARLSELRAQLDSAALTLSSADRARLREVGAYRSALSALPAAAFERNGLAGAARADAEPAASADQRFRRLAGIAKRLTAETHPRRLYELLLDSAIDLTHAESGFLMLRDREGELRVRAGRTLGERDQAERGISHSIVARVLASGQALSTVDALRDERLSGASSVHALALRSVLVVPLRSGAEILGVIYLDDRLRPFAFGEDEVALLSDLADLASIALEAIERLRRERRAARRLRATQAELARQLEAQAIELASWKGAKQLAGEHAGIVAHSPAMRETLELALRVARSDVPVLIRGESGTGKELIAKAIHAASSRKGRPFVSENCGAIPETLLESTLFGHVKGAFTGADRRHHGLFEAADGGTLFLDEIGEMSPSMQVRLLRVLQDGEVRPIGGERSIKVDVRVLSATHRDVDTMLERGGFREDLFYRLAVVSMALPPLRERSDDVLPLVQHFLAKYAPGRATKLDKRVLERLTSHAWPGNVRQLENEVRRALALASGETLREEHFGVFAQRQGSAEPADLDLRGHVDELERKLIRRALDAARGNQTRAAELLGVSRFGLQKMLKRLFPNESLKGL